MAERLTYKLYRVKNVIKAPDVVEVTTSDIGDIARWENEWGYSRTKPAAPVAPPAPPVRQSGPDTTKPKVAKGG